MAILYVDGANWADGVYSNDSSSEFPCMDSNYRNLRWSFRFPKEFANYTAMVTFEQTTLPTYFSNREKSVSHAGKTENNCILQSYKRVSILTPGPPLWAEYEVVFTKAG